MKQEMVDVLREHAKANINLHKANINVYLKNPSGIGEHSDIMEAMQAELDKMAMHEDRLEILDTYFDMYEVEV
tara:strand:+ start:1758 stop:1976 length:219 start_codon:yes stop_codon:yes gene_type:complete